MTMIRVTLIFFLVAGKHYAQISSAKITFERRTNLLKKYKHERNAYKWFKEDEKIKTEYFEMFVSDTFSVFRPKESDLKELYTWATTKNTVYQDLKKNARYSIKMMWGDELHLTDTLTRRSWQIASGTRKIAGYVCRKAVWKVNDSTRIYAWFSYDLLPSTGPESFNGLPGTILGLATEDGGVVYFATNVEAIKPPAEVFKLPSKKKIYTSKEVIGRLTERYGHEKWFKREMTEQFGIW
jgi:GLPGLI family protein